MSAKLAVREVVAVLYWKRGYHSTRVKRMLLALNWRSIFSRKVAALLAVVKRSFQAPVTLSTKRGWSILAFCAILNIKSWTNSLSRALVTSRREQAVSSASLRQRKAVR